MNSSHVETETKLYVPNLGAVAQRLGIIGAILVKPRVFERNVRYENAEKTLTERGIVVRLRQDTTAKLTYKEPADFPAVDGIQSRREWEVEVNDFDTMEAILARLGYYPQLVYEKWRATYTLGQVEIVLDELPFGNFLEIEGTPDDIYQAIAALQLQDAPRYAASYLILFDRVKQTLHLDFNDLTFANFQGIVVSPDLFSSK